MKEKFRIAIEQKYGFRIKNTVAAPRQFVAETYIIETQDAKKYFCKLVDKVLFIPNIIRSLPICKEMHDKGIKRISYPITSKEGLYVQLDDTLIVLFNFIPAEQSYDYNMREFGKLTATIHALTPSITTSIPKESFKFEHEPLFLRHFQEGLNSASNNSVEKNLKVLLKKHERMLQRLYESFAALQKKYQGSKTNLVITHGDAPGNVLVKSFDDIYLIDWDEILLAPCERDMWMVDHDEEFIKGYKSIFPEYKPNSDLRAYCIYSYFFHGFIHYTQEIFKSIDDDKRMKQVLGLKDGLLEGWMLPKLSEIEDEL